MAGKPWADIETEIIADMRKRAFRLRQAADDLERKADEFEAKKKSKDEADQE